MKTILLSLIAFVSIYNVNATSVTEKLFINRGLFTTVDSVKFPYLAFNPDTAFNAHNHVIRINKNDSLLITVINNDSISTWFYG